MKLSQFLTLEAEAILLAWDEFAATVSHEGAVLDKQALRDHAGEILQTIARDMAQPQSAAEQLEKSKGLRDSATTGPETAAETHADTRMISGFAIDAMIREYRALRATILRLWLASGGGPSHQEDMQEIIRFNEAIDQAIAESVGRYTDQTKKSTDLFIGILGHDIRNPLSTICMSAEYLVRSGQLSAAAAQTIINSTVRINSVIEHVVDFTRAQSDGMMPINPRPGNLAAQFSKVIEETRVRSPRAVLALEASGDFEGVWDEGRMGQLLSNLLANALSYGARSQPVTVRMWATPDEVACSVHNFGSPIPVKEQARIFQALTRGSLADKQEHREPGGLGLGLYICKEIVLAHGGTLTVESEAVKGTVFTLRLPRVAPATRIPRAPEKPLATP